MKENDIDFQKNHKFGA